MNARLKHEGKPHQFNVVLGEAATVISPEGDEVPRWHEVCLYLETLPGDPRDGQDEEIARVETELKQAGWDVRVLPLRAMGGSSRYIGSFEVNLGKIGMPAIDWRDQLRNVVRGTVAEADLEKYDLDCAAVTTDLGCRGVRLIFPRRGAVRLEVKQVDEPNVLIEVTREVSNAGYSILCTHLRIGGAGQNTATMVAVCEPVAGADRGKLDAAAARLNADPRFRAARVLPAIPFDKCLFPGLPPNELVRQLLHKHESGRLTALDAVNTDALLRVATGVAKFGPEVARLLQRIRAGADLRAPGRRLCYVRTQRRSIVPDHFDVVVRQLVLAVRGSLDRPAHQCVDGDLHTSLDDALPRLAAADRAIFVLRRRQSARENARCIQELCLFRMLHPDTPEHRTLLIVDGDQNDRQWEFHGDMSVNHRNVWAPCDEDTTRLAEASLRNDPSEVLRADNPIAAVFDFLRE